jgi:alkylhydroperoxidase family enzyme
VTARENRAWYAAEHARVRYAAGGRDIAALASFESLEAAVAPGWAEALRFTRKLTTAPQTIGDADVARLREHFSDAETAEIIDSTGDANAFDRLTESLRLPLEF